MRRIEWEQRRARAEVAQLKRWCAFPWAAPPQRQHCSLRVKAAIPSRFSSEGDKLGPPVAAAGRSSLHSVDRWTTRRMDTTGGKGGQNIVLRSGDQEWCPKAATYRCMYCCDIVSLHIIRRPWPGPDALLLLPTAVRGARSIRGDRYQAALAPATLPVGLYGSRLNQLESSSLRCSTNLHVVWWCYDRVKMTLP